MQELLDGRWNDCVPDQEHSLGDTLPRNSVPRGLFVYTAVTRERAARRTIPLVRCGAARTFVAHCNGVVHAAGCTAAGVRLRRRNHAVVRGCAPRAAPRRRTGSASSHRADDRARCGTGPADRARCGSGPSGPAVLGGLGVGAQAHPLGIEVDELPLDLPAAVGLLVRVGTLQLPEE